MSFCTRIDLLSLLLLLLRLLLLLLLLLCLTYHDGFSLLNVQFYFFFLSLKFKLTLSLLKALFDVHFWQIFTFKSSFGIGFNLRSLLYSINLIIDILLWRDLLLI